VSEALEESYTYCCSLTKRTAKNFHFAFRGLPADVYRSMCALYAFLRETDDIGDAGSVPFPERQQRLDRWCESLDESLAGQRAADPVFPALADTVRRHEIPRRHLDAVIEGVRTDLSPVEFATFEELAHYCYCVAGSVGLCCIAIWGYDDPRAESAAVDCGLAFQLTNILRDLQEDARMGRVYLPREDLTRFGYSVEDIRRGCNDARFRELMAFEVARARECYETSRTLSEWVSPVGRPILQAMRALYRGILEKIEANGYDVYHGRIELPRWRKLLIATRAAVRQRLLG
jgi:phytoene synthase